MKAIAHRGYSHYFPENTLLALEEAFKLGIKLAEVDVNSTQDGRLVLFHDQPTMHRTSNGQNFIERSTFEEISQLDYGTWKDEAFAGTPVTPIEDGLLLAEQYDAQLYLDTKGFHPELYAQALQSTGVSPIRFCPAMGKREEIEEFKSLCPQTPFVFFGSWIVLEEMLPESERTGNELSIKELAENDCQAVEIFFETALNNTPEFQKLRDLLHVRGIELWVFTTNDSEQFKKIADVGVDGIETDLPWEMSRMYCEGMPIKTPIPGRTTGNWNFENGTTYGVGVGSQMLSFNFDDSFAEQSYTISSSSSFGLPQIENQDVNVMAVPALRPGNGLMVYTNFTPTGYADLHYDYTLIMDIFYPQSAVGKWVSLIQTNPENFNDGDLFIDPEGDVGINNDYHGPLNVGEWNRLIFSVTRETIVKYINGEYVGSNEIEGNRWSLINNFPGGNKQGFHLFADNDDETAEMFLSALQIRNYPVSQNEAERLGEVKAEGIKNMNSTLYDISSSDLSQNSLLIDRYNQIIYVEGGELLDPRLNFVYRHSYDGTDDLVKAGNYDISHDAIRVYAEDDYYFTDYNFCYQGKLFLATEEHLESFEVYPNPSRGKLTIQRNEASTAKVNILNSTGQHLSNYDLNTQSGDFDLSELHDGLYYISVESEGHVTTKRWVKQN
ncbi:glycerophosphodiester phosphodiesterase family protein [Jiulongibacter sp. NS-SX5]|uniref:glycerophosphodiester phosphodiesterase family protein n=1 Tax=Jiulongibacter sp. NS-SX5 TaxID=3463854 RepID=UPI004058B48E